MNAGVTNMYVSLCIFKLVETELVLKHGPALITVEFVSVLTDTTSALTTGIPSRYSHTNTMFATDESVCVAWALMLSAS